jgi:hypothetical protein
MNAYHYITLLPALLTALTAGGTVLLGLRSKNRRSGLLAAGFALSLLATALRHVMGRFYEDSAAYLEWDRPLMAVFLFSLPVAIHLIHTQARMRRGRWVYRSLYALMAVTAALGLFSDFLITGHLRAPSGLIARPGVGMYGFAALSLVGGAVFLPMLSAAPGRRSLDQQHQRALVYGLLGCVLLCFGDLVAGVGLLPLPPSVFCFLPMAAVTWSLLHADLASRGRDVIERGAANDVAFAVLLVAVATVAAVLPSLYAEQDGRDILRRFFPNALPATLSTVVCLGIAFATFAKGSRNLGTLLFGICSALWGMYTADLALVATLTDPHAALWVSRIDHLGLVLNIPITYHACVAIAGMRQRRWLLYLGYGLAVLTLPLVLTDLYIPGMHHYWFGYFAQAGPAMQIYLGLGIPLGAYGIVHLWRASRTHPDERTRNLARYLSTAFSGALLLVLGALPGINGIPLYPPAQFLFVPFVLAASGILMTRAVAFRTFLRVSLVRVLAMVVLSLAYALAIVAVADATAGQQRMATVGIIALVTAVVFVPVVRHVWDWLSETDPQASSETEPRLRTLCRRLARESRVEETAQRLCREITQVLECEASLVIIGEGSAARFTGVRLVENAATPVHVWADDPLLRSIIKNARTSPGPDVPAVNEGVLFDLLPELRLVAPITYQGELVGLMGVGARQDGRHHDQRAWEWMEQLSERVAPYLQISLYYAADTPDAMRGLSLPSSGDLPDTEGSSGTDHAARG